MFCRSGLKAFFTAILIAPTFALKPLKTSVVQLGDISYYLKEKVDFAYEFEIEDAFPFTVVTTNESIVTGPWLNATISRFLETDDVFNSSFLAGIFVQNTNTGSIRLNTEAQTFLSQWNNTKVIFDTGCNTTIPEGPYFATCEGLHAAWKLYEDPLESFVLSTTPTEDPNTYVTVEANVQMAHTLSIAVPSRLYFTKTTEKPLAGVRVAIKDLFDLKGVKTGGSCRAYLNCYPPRNASAPSVQHLIDLGAIIIGKTKTTQFADGENPTADWVDYHCPFNPRADGYQSPAASSAGSGSAMANYDWVDHALGSDTGGSVRFPAAAQNIFGLRPSHGIISLEGVLPITKYFDTVGFFARDVDGLNNFGGLFYGNVLSNFTQFPSKIIYPLDYWSAPTNDSLGVSDVFVQQLESFLGVQRTIVNLSSLWDETSPTKTPIADYLNTTFSHVHAIDHYRNYDQFRADYHSQFKKAPYVNPQIQYKWSFGANLTQADQDEALIEKANYKSWFEKEVLIADNETCSDAIMVLPLTFGTPSYRDNYFPKPTWSGIGWGESFQSVFAETPELAIPVGQTPFMSRVSGREEQLPVVVSIMAAKYCDYMILNLVRELKGAGGFVGEVKTGPTAF